MTSPPAELDAATDPASAGLTADDLLVDLPAADLPTAADLAYRTIVDRSPVGTGDARVARFTTFSAFARSVQAHRGDPPDGAGIRSTRGGAPRGPAGAPRDPAALAALTRFASILREHGYGDGTVPADPGVGTCFRLGYGSSADRHSVESVIGAGDLAALVGAGWAEHGDVDPAFVRLTMTVLAAGPVLTVSPRPAPGLDTVYVGPDSLALLRRAWAAGGGGRAADLGTGNGFIAAALATRFDHVVGTDLSARCVDAAALVPILNPSLAGRMAVIRADTGAGLAPGTFDLVTANPPWVPEPLRGERAPVRRFAAGGPTGFELPRRFLDAAAALLAPGGRGFVSCLDVELADARRPLSDHLPALHAAGCTVDVHPSGMPGGDDLRGWVKDRLGRVPAARHVIVELHALG